MEYNFEREGSISLTEKIWKNLEQQYSDLKKCCLDYNLVLDESLDTFDKFLELFDNEYYNCGNFSSFQPPYFDITLLVEGNTVSSDNMLFLPKQMANKFRLNDIYHHYNPISNTWFDSLILCYLDNWDKILNNYGEDVCVEIEQFIQMNSNGRNIAESKKGFAKIITRIREQEELEQNGIKNMCKELRNIIKTYGNLLDEEDIDALGDIVKKYK